MDSADYVTKPHAKGMVGVGGHFSFLFKLEGDSNLHKIFQNIIDLLLLIIKYI